jgi:hypothetical protein
LEIFITVSKYAKFLQKIITDSLRTFNLKIIAVSKIFLWENIPRIPGTI